MNSMMILFFIHQLNTSFMLKFLYQFMIENKKFININKTLIFLGSDFYSPSDPCFIYYDIQEMKCLKAKSEYTLY